jgi:hypothetical protein
MILRMTGLAIIGLLAIAGPAQAYCPVVPAQTDAEAAENARQRIICLNQQIDDTTKAIGQASQYQGLSDMVQRNEIQRRFDMLPPVRTNPQF